MNIYTIHNTITYDQLIELLPIILKKNHTKIQLSEEHHQNIINEMIKELNTTGRTKLFNKGWYPNLDKIKQSMFIQDLYQIRNKKIDAAFLFPKYDLYTYVYKSLSEINNDIKSECDPDPFFVYIMYNQKYIYPRSFRARTTMKIFQHDQLQITLPTNLLNELREGKLIEIEGKYALPVTRYSCGMNRSLFYNDTTNIKYCGTFYYYEIDSDILLSFNTYLYAINKFDAFVKMIWEALGEGDINIYDNKYDKNKFVEKKREELEVFFNNVKNYKTESNYDFFDKYVKFIKGEKVFEFDNNYIKYNDGTSVINDYYAIEDDLDQPLCRLASGMDQNFYPLPSKINYEVIYLEKMVGTNRFVSEVLDTRPRKDSINSLIFILNK